MTFTDIPEKAQIGRAAILRGSSPTGRYADMAPLDTPVAYPSPAFG
ncbi:hypothetical protein [Runella slithyformis]|nr:hypothetical protein [Runella slithyformis]